MKIGDEVYVHGYVDEIRQGVVIIRNNGGYFGTVAEEVLLPGIDHIADRKTEPFAKDINVRSKDEPQTERHLPDYSYEADLGRRIMEQTERSE